ncbi:Lar family restriction alleviation protein [Acetobacter orientalis]|uniref:Lar family restriction alleviation protein n=1 Tax=Acetobacter orientalis TaxID=146474 RepID=UPI003862EE8D
MSEELKSCPFCGSSNLHTPHPKHTSAWVTCNVCNAEGPIKHTRAEAIAAWNTRAGENS